MVLRGYYLFRSVSNSAERIAEYTGIARVPRRQVDSSQLVEYGSFSSLAVSVKCKNSTTETILHEQDRANILQRGF